MSPVDVQELRRLVAEAGEEACAKVTWGPAQQALVRSLLGAAPAILDELEALRAEVSELRDWQIQARVREDLARVAADESRETIKALRAQVANASHALSLAGFGGTLVEQVGAVLERVRAVDRKPSSIVLREMLEKP